MLFIDRYTKVNYNFIKDYYSNKESPHLRYWDINNFYGWEMSQRFPVNDCKWVGDNTT